MCSSKMAEGKQRDVLIAYYSRKGENLVNGSIHTLRTGNTEIAAITIQKLTGADLFQIVPVRDYPEEYCRCIDLARQDLLRNVRPELKQYPDGMESYSEIYLGYPNYWGTMPAPVWTFLEHFDFSGKTIHPLCTYEDSGFGHSLEDLRRICPTAKIDKGLAVRGVDVQDETETIEQWINTVCV